jgi:hypothetical protein
MRPKENFFTATISDAKTVGREERLAASFIAAA